MNKSIAFITLKTSIKTDNTRNRDYRQNTETCATRNMTECVHYVQITKSQQGKRTT